MRSHPNPQPSQSALRRALLAMRLDIGITQAPVLPLSAGHHRRWGLWFLLHAAIGKPLHSHLSAGKHAAPDTQVVLNPVLDGHAPPLRKGQTLQVDLLIASSIDVQPTQVLRFLQQHLGPHNPVHLTGSIPLPPPPSPPLPSAPRTPGTGLETVPEAVLEFQTPLPFRRETDSRTQISPATLGQLLALRSRQVWGPAAGEIFQALWNHQPIGHLICGYWKFVDIPRASASQNRGINTHERRSRLSNLAQADPALHLQHHSGCLGRLYVRQVSPELMAWLQALAPWHLHSSAGVSVWGGYAVTSEPRPWFDPQLADVQALVTVAEATFRAYDVPPGRATHLRQPTQPAPQTEAEMALLLAQELSRGSWQPEPTEGFHVPKANGRSRLVERLCLRDLVVQKRLGGLLAPVLDASFSPNSLGYRKGLSRTDATHRIRQLIREGHRWVVEADIEDFFPSADHTRIEAALDRLIPLADSTLRTLVARAMRAPCHRSSAGSDQFEPASAPRTQGLAQGAPLSPLLANLLLDHLDKALEPIARNAMVRYADDFVLLARSQRQAEEFLQQVTHEVAELGLRLSADKTRITCAEDGFEFLGEHFDLDRLEDPITTVAGQRKPLVITDSYLHLGLNGQALDIRQDNKLIDTVPLRRISEVVIFGRNSLSTALMQRLAEHKVPVSVALSGGYQIAVLHPDSRRHHEIAWKQSSWYYSLNDASRLSIAQAFLDAKLNGYRALVRKRSPICTQTVAQVDRALNALGECATIDQLRGHEGLAARAIFAWLQNQIRPDLQTYFQAKRRARGGPDRLNSLLNFGYYLSYTRLNGLLRAHGLNPYLGFLHDSLDDYETLVADLQELVRPFVDRLVIQLVNIGHIGPNAFEQTDRGLLLTKPAARIMAREFERTMGQRVINQRLGDMLVTQIRQLRAFMCEGAPLWLFHFGLQDPGNDLPPEQYGPAGFDDTDELDADDNAAPFSGDHSPTSGEP